MIGLTKEKLVELLEFIGTFSSESSAIDGWALAWHDFFENAVAKYAEGNPDSVVVQGSALRMGLNSILGSSDASGAYVRVRCGITDIEETRVSQWDTENFIVTSSFLGQSTPSTTVTDYDVVNTAVIPDNLDTPKAAFGDALAGMSEEGETAQKLQDAVEAWWDELVASPGDYFKDATAITAPSGLSGLKDDLEVTFAENVEADPPLTTEEAYGNIVDDFLVAISGGTVTINSVTEDIE